MAGHLLRAYAACPQRAGCLQEGDPGQGPALLAGQADEGIQAQRSAQVVPDQDHSLLSKSKSSSLCYVVLIVVFDHNLLSLLIVLAVMCWLSCFSTAS